MKYLLTCLVLILLACSAWSSTVYLKADGFLKAVELNQGDTLIYELKSGARRVFVIEHTAANSFASFADTGKGYQRGRLYSMSCTINADGQSLAMHRLVPARQSFYQPLLINDVYLFFDGVRSVDAFMEDAHGKKSGSFSTCYPQKEVRLALMEYGEMMCNEIIGEWFPHPKPYFEIEEAYHGGDCWMGPYSDNEAHNGLDINVSNHTPLWAPIAFDSQFYFNSVAQGQPNNRWNGFRTWPNGDRWMLRSHHMTKLLVPEHTPVQKHQQYGEVGGMYFGSHPHSHFYFTITHSSGEYPLDPWILFWQIFENRKRKQAAIKADFNLTGEALAGKPLFCRADGSQPGAASAGRLTYSWATSDGGFGEGIAFSHRFARPGVHCIALTVSDGTDTARLIRHITVNEGQTAADKTLSLIPFDSLSFKWPIAGISLPYGAPPETYGRYLDVYYRKNEPSYAAQSKVLWQSKGIKKAKPEITIDYQHDSAWLSCVVHKDTLLIALNTNKLSRAAGTSIARIYVKVGELSEMVVVRATAPYHDFTPADTVVLDERSALCFPSDFYWVTQPYEYDFLKGYNDKITLSVPLAKQQTPTLRYAPDLTAGKYLIQMHPESNVDVPEFKEKMSGYRVKVQTAEGPRYMEWNPLNGPLGTFNLLGAKSSYVDLMPLHGNGITVMDALMFVKAKE